MILLNFFLSYHLIEKRIFLFFRLIFILFESLENDRDIYNRKAEIGILVQSSRISVYNQWMKTYVSTSLNIEAANIET